MLQCFFANTFRILFATKHSPCMHTHSTPSTHACTYALSLTSCTLTHRQSAGTAASLGSPLFHPPPSDFFTARTSSEQPIFRSSRARAEQQYETTKTAAMCEEDDADTDADAESSMATTSSTASRSPDLADGHDELSREPSSRRPRSTPSPHGETHSLPSLPGLVVRDTAATAARG